MGRNSNQLVGAGGMVKLGAFGVLGVAILIGILSAVFTTKDGSVTIVSAFGKAHTAADPGLGFKTPIKDSTETVSIRPRRLTNDYQGSAKPNEGSDSIGLTADLRVSVNWTPVKSGILDLYVKHGKLENFENVILSTRIQAAVKAASAQYSPKDMLGRRAELEVSIKDALLLKIPGYVEMVKLNAVQVDNVGFPKSYLEQIEAEQVASKKADAALQETRRKANENQQIVDLATTNKEKRLLEADAAAYEVTTASAAQAQAIKDVGDAEVAVLEAKAAVVTTELNKLLEIQQWNGVRSTTVVGGDASGGVLLDARQ